MIQDESEYEMNMTKKEKKQSCERVEGGDVID